jgi:hypothetical protein
MPFADQRRRTIHFRLHGHEFGAADEFEYERMADAFMARALDHTLQQCYRPNNDRVRFEFVTFHIGAVRMRTAALKTFYIVNAQRVARYGGVARYFQYECNRVED